MKRSIAGWMAGVLLMAGAALAEGASVTIQRMQQRYPWNGLVDIDYTVAGVPDGQSANYYVRFKLKRDGRTFVLHDFLDDSKLIDAVNGSYRVTWDSAAEKEEYHFIADPVGLQAELVYCANGKANSPYAIKYLIIDLSAGAAATSYPVETRRFATQEAANAMFNTDEYKTTKLVLRKVRAGSFMMGSPTDEVGRESGSWMCKETQHRVTFTKGYYIGVFLVTARQWQLVMGTNPAIGDYEKPVGNIAYKDIRGTSNGIKVPITGEVDADSFLGRLRARTGLAGLDLPTWAQWECACRAGTTASTYFGNNVKDDAELLKAHIWYKANAAGAVQAVGAKPANPWGLYDMIGNVWEFCLDRITKDADGGHDLTSSPAVDPLVQVVDGNVAIPGGPCVVDDDCRLARAAVCGCNGGVILSSTYYGFRLGMTER